MVPEGFANWATRAQHRDCSALWGEAPRQLQGALQPRRSPTHQHCCGTVVMPARCLALGRESCIQSCPCRRDSTQTRPASPRHQWSLGSRGSTAPRHGQCPMGEGCPRPPALWGALHHQCPLPHTCHGGSGKLVRQPPWQTSATFLIF